MRPRPSVKRQTFNVSTCHYCAVLVSGVNLCGMCHSPQYITKQLTLDYAVLNIKFTYYVHCTLQIKLSSESPGSKLFRDKRDMWVTGLPEIVFGLIKCDGYAITISKMSERQTKAGNQIKLSHSHSLTVSLSLTLVILNNFCFHVYAQKSLSHSHTISLSQCLTLSFFHSLIHSLSTY